MAPPPPPIWLRCRCTSSARPAPWAHSMPAAKLCAALHEDARTDVGRRLDNIVAAKRDATGRAEFVSIQGERRREVSGWDFKIVVGRKLGWSFLKSSRFEVARHGSDF